MENYVPDTSVIIAQILSKEINEGTLKGRILIPNSVIAELEHQANSGQEIGLIGLIEIKTLREQAEKGLIKLDFIGERPSADQIRYAKKGEIDALIRKLAYDNKATLVTADLVQTKSAEAFGIITKYYDFRKKETTLDIEKYFDKNTMSVHLKEDVEPMAKKGTPGNYTYEKISKQKINKEEIQDLVDNINEVTRNDDKSFIEIARKGSTIIQARNYRIIITKPPFSKTIEITAVKPIKETRLSDYELPDKIIERIDKEANGIIICGKPGAGKSTFAEAIAKHYHKKGSVIKTIESPRDLQLGPEITQYNKALARNGELHDIILLSRPDYTIFDEVRETSDFKLYTDLRLSGIGMLGVTHGADAISTIQRFIERTDIGMIPNIIDTVIFIEQGQVKKIYSINMKVRTPSGMYESDLSRPVIEVKDYNTNETEYEIYTYGDQTIVMPLIKKKQAIEDEIKKHAPNAQIKRKDNNITIITDSKSLKKLIGSDGKNIKRLEKKHGINIDVKKK